MAEADIAYVATAGAAGLALAVSAWAVRLRARLQAQAASDARRLETLQAELAGRNGALAAMDVRCLQKAACARFGVYHTPDR